MQPTPITLNVTGLDELTKLVERYERAVRRSAASPFGGLVGKVLLITANSKGVSHYDDGHYFVIDEAEDLIRAIHLTVGDHNSGRAESFDRSKYRFTETDWSTSDLWDYVHRLEYWSKTPERGEKLGWVANVYTRAADGAAQIRRVLRSLGFLEPLKFESTLKHFHMPPPHIHIGMRAQAAEDLADVQDSEEPDEPDAEGVAGPSIPTADNVRSSYQGPGFYYHYKGTKYYVRGLGMYEPSGRKSDRYVIYTPADQLNISEPDIWLRPLSNFNEWVTDPSFEHVAHFGEAGRLVRRFVRVNS